MNRSIELNLWSSKKNQVILLVCKLATFTSFLQYMINGNYTIQNFYLVISETEHLIV